MSISTSMVFEDGVYTKWGDGILTSDSPNFGGGEVEVKPIMRGHPPCAPSDGGGRGCFGITYIRLMHHLGSLMHFDSLLSFVYFVYSNMQHIF